MWIRGPRQLWRRASYLQVVKDKVHNARANVDEENATERPDDDLDQQQHRAHTWLQAEQIREPRREKALHNFYDTH